MSAVVLLGWVVQALVFLAWAHQMFSVLFEMRRRAEAESGQSFPGPRTALQQWRRWLSAPEDRRQRNRLILLTFALLLMSFLSSVGGAREGASAADAASPHLPQGTKNSTSSSGSLNSTLSGASSSSVRTWKRKANWEKAPPS